MKTVFALCAMLLGVPVTAQTYDVVLGGKVLGTLSYEETANRNTLTSTLTNTPLGVFNGTFTGNFAGGTFTGDSRSSRKQRRVEVTMEKGRVSSVQITPSNERTEMSDPARILGSVTDPVRALGQLIHSNKGCPDDLTLYDGRRIVALRRTGRTQKDTVLTCNIRYSVTDGPGHLSPLKIASAKMVLRYDIAEGQTLEEIEISSGIFKLRLDRRD